MTIYLITGILFYTSTRVNVIRDQACGNIAEKNTRTITYVTYNYFGDCL
jgi:hypothetical protein